MDKNIIISFSFIFIHESTIKSQSTINLKEE